ncbi:hypothetical protein Phum_PHUM529350 [Pediculus humanus corporis]|uniref:Uncharacterized protein n=1 Tax=Pediculus humanus subsp. corporis TaxID=121224 RepID=E0VZ94_PEDHC|nr:uncharacterized protein Phum_PHUM529350 [Pediculus humanus corporis]EEB18700.1 hypothetical protein Phum_PHUM529350 [Pediculus humanus corporis]
MNTTVSSFQQNLSSDRKTVDKVQKDVKKWVDSVVEFKANLDKKKNEPPLEKHLKKIKKFKVKKKTSSSALKVTTPKSKFEQIKEIYKTVKLPHNWTSGVSSGRIVFNRIHLTTQNSQQKMAVERSLVITKDCNTHVLIKGSEIVMNNWEMQKINSVDDVKKAIKEIDSLKLTDNTPVNNVKNPQCYIFTEENESGEKENITQTKNAL